MSVDLKQIPDGFYAVPDPDRPDQMTYWRMRRRKSSASFGPWPAKARYGPQLAREDVPTDPAARAELLDRYRAEAIRYSNAVMSAVVADPVAAARRFAEFATSCCVCGRRLEDDYSKVVGIGPDCRAGMSAEALATYGVSAVGRAHSQRLDETDQTKGR